MMFGRGNAITKSLPTGGAFPAEVPIFMVGGQANYGSPQSGPNYSPITQPISNPFTTTARAPPRSGYGQFGPTQGQGFQAPTQQIPIRTPIRNPFTTIATTRRPTYQPAINNPFTTTLRSSSYATPTSSTPRPMVLVTTTPRTTYSTQQQQDSYGSPQGNVVTRPTSREVFRSPFSHLNGSNCISGLQFNEVSRNSRGMYHCHP